MSKNRNSYGSILKSIGLFGGVQVFQILVGLVKNKIVAVLLGPAGMGIVGMITNATSVVETLTGFGLRTSATRGIANATSEHDEYKMGRILSVVRRLVFFTGLLGTASVFLIAKYLSIWSFGTTDYTIAFRLVSVTAFFNQLCIGQTTLMQGTFHYKLMAKAALWGSIIGLIVSIPLYYNWGETAIVPVIIISSLTSLIFSSFYSRKISYRKIKLSNKEVWSDGRGMLGLGLAIALTGAVGLGQTYLIRAFISNTGSISDVGLYTAGITLTSMYVNTILNAMASDYSPRLASLSNERLVFIDTINRQLKLLVTIIVPMIIMFMVIIRELTILLYSDKFLAVTTMIEWMIAGMFFRTTSWCLSFAQVARGDSKVFFWNEFACTVYSLIYAVTGYLFFKFDGLGIAFVLQYMTYSVQMYYLSRRRFGYTVSNDTLKLIVKHFLLLIIVVMTMRLLHYTIWRYVVGGILIMVSLLLSYHHLNQMIPVKESIKNYIQRYKKK